ncbi:MAG TPA: RIP metalloprotease RseP [Bacteroidales bacterium]|nr:RIP metalloprotease RseP [Bacteroidales bacterium]HPF01857.1 RIP metalloprotease RseP [Bacteroidales bacterium]HPJ58226.1 RIP metalloprotease RseP [Bacteroidales bacterium]HPR11557.1 RIP metalloprotease RseP [Bacteroidales bacterium]HRW84299.1 RIP metalloprotease RseP [Bacteroidales bacterium]
MEILIRILQFLVSLSILVIIHELGHFIMAKVFKTRVEKFYLFFDAWFSIFKFRRGETEYGMGWIPLGGYVKISGMIDESMDVEQMKKPPQPWEFRSKKAWQRLLIMTGGVIFNFLLALLIYVFILFVWGKTYLPTENAVYGIVTDSTGLAMGLRNGDKILSVDNQHIENFDDILKDIILNKRTSIQVERNGEKVNVPIPDDYVPNLLKGRGTFEVRAPFGPFVVKDYPKHSPAKDAGVLKGDELAGIDSVTFSYYDEFQTYLKKNINKTVVLQIIRDGERIEIPMTIAADGKLGVLAERSPSMYFEMKTLRYGFFESIPAGIARGFREMGDYLKQFRLIFSKDTKAYESLGGFITIGSIFPAQWDWLSFWNVTAFLSIILAVMNILPIPALDGGHVMFLLFEVVTGRKPSDKFLEYAQIAGMIILFSLLIFANGNDIIRLIRK